VRLFQPHADPALLFTESSSIEVVDDSSKINIAPPDFKKNPHVCLLSPTPSKSDGSQLDHHIRIKRCTPICQRRQEVSQAKGETPAGKGGAGGRVPLGETSRTTFAPRSGWSVDAVALREAFIDKHIQICLVSQVV
jgi:hypothetical protein